MSARGTEFFEEILSRLPSEFWETVDLALSDLGEEDRLLYRLWYDMQKPLADIAAVMGYSGPKQAGSRARRMRFRLRARLRYRFTARDDADLWAIVHEKLPEHGVILQALERRVHTGKAMHLAHGSAETRLREVWRAMRLTRTAGKLDHRLAALAELLHYETPMRNRKGNPLSGRL